MAITSAKKELRFKLSLFNGMNSYVSSNRIQDQQSAELINVELNPGGNITKRPPRRLASNFPSPLETNVCLGFFNVNSTNYFLVCTETTLYQSTDGFNWFSIPGFGGGTGAYAVQYVNTVYIATADGVYKWDGTTLSLIPGSPAGTFITVFKDRLFVINSEGATTTPTSSRLYFSDALDPDTWTGTNFVDVGSGDRDFLTCAYPIGDKLLVFKSNSIWSLYVQGSPISWILRINRKDEGCVARNSLVEIEGALYFLSAQKVYKTDGVNFVSISEPIRDHILDQVDKFSYDEGYAVEFNHRYILSMGQNVVPSISGVYVYYLDIGGWTNWEFDGGFTPRFYVRAVTATYDRIYFRTYDGTSFSFTYMNDPADSVDSLLDNFVTEYPITILSKVFDYGDEYKYKRGKQLHLYMDAMFDDPEDYVELTYITDDHEEAFKIIDIEEGLKPYRLKGPGYFKTLQYKIESTNARKFNLYSYELLASVKSDFSESSDSTWV